MNRSKSLASIIVLLTLPRGALVLAEDPLPDVIISEVLAVNDKNLEDIDGQYRDWIEVYNTSGAQVDMEGWALTDDARDLGKWIFPAMTLEPAEFRLVFASGKDLRDPAGELHTNFNLDGQGELLLLVDPSGTAVSGFAPKLPPQVADVSYGVRMTGGLKKLISAGDTARYLVPASNELGVTWTAPGFDDTGWASGPTGIGYDSKPEPTYKDLIKTDVGALMQGTATSLYVRIAFNVDPADVAKAIELRLRYADGVVAFLGGVEVARRNFSATTPAYNSRASKSRSEADALTPETITITPRGLLKAGTNVLAIQALNYRNTELDMLLVPELDLIEVQSIDPEVNGYFTAPSPGMPNASEVLPALTEEPDFSQPSGAYKASFSLELSTLAPGAQIRYTLDGFEPKETSTLYAGPVTIDATTIVKAKAFQAGQVPSPTVTRTFLFVDSALYDFNSNVPVVICSTIGTRIGDNCGTGPYTKGHVFIFQPGQDGRARISGEPHVADIAGFRKRGSSTCGWPKFAFNVELKESFDAETAADLRVPDPLGAAKNMEVLGMPSDSDWIMFAPYDFDFALMRNPLAYWMSREVGCWAARTRFVECFLINNTTAKPRAAKMTDYFGVYVFMEKIKQHPDRADVEPMTSKDLTEPRITGGYILKRDRVGGGEMVTAGDVGGYGSMIFVYPKQPKPQQNAYITKHANEVIASLNPNIGSQADSDLIDVEEWIDHHILVFYPKNVDAFRLSGFMYQKRSGLFSMGPVWDFDRTMGCANDNRPESPEGWANGCWGGGDCGTLYFAAGGMGSWYSKLFNNTEPTGNSPWARAYRKRWRELRAGPLSTENINRQIDAWAAELAEPAKRNFQKWPATTPRFGSFQGEVNHLKNWLATRGAWIDSQFIEPPQFSPPGGRVDTGTQVTITSGETEGTTYYTLNGTDPKAANDTPAPDAVEYAGPITITQNVKIRARLRVGVTASWSEVAEAIYVTSIPSIAITEIMYNAPKLPEDTFSSASSYDFLEVYNFGKEPLDLNGFRLMVVVGTTVQSLRQSFAFSSGSVTVLEPDKYLVVCSNLDAFRARYKDGPDPVGKYTSSLGDSTTTLELQGPIGEAIGRFAYDDDWYPETDGGGYSLVLRDPKTPPEAWGDPTSWRASLKVLGSPGGPDGDSPAGGLQLPGDFSQDRQLNVTDGVQILLYLFQGGETPCSTEAATLALGDTNGDAQFNLTDAVYLLNYLFLGGDPPAAGTGCIRIVDCPSACEG